MTSVFIISFPQMVHFSSEVSCLTSSHCIMKYVSHIGEIFVFKLDSKASGGYYWFGLKEDKGSSDGVRQPLDFIVCKAESPYEVNSLRWKSQRPTTAITTK